MKVYYAHHIWKYNTPIEEYELQLIKSHFYNWDIINPNGAIVQGRSEEEIMTDCLKSVSDSDALVFSSVNGIVGYGVMNEVIQARTSNKKVYYIENNQLTEVKTILWNVLNESHRIYAIPNINS